MKPNLVTSLDQKDIGYSIDEILKLLEKVIEHGYGEINLIVKAGRIQEIGATETWRKTKN